MPTGGTERKLLSSWKGIASYLEVSVRTAQYWEAHRGLPVRRVPGQKGGVWAEAEELDSWRRTKPEEPGWWLSPRFLRLWSAGATAVLVVAGVAWLLSTRRGPPARFHHESKSLVVTDEQGRELWRKTFEEPFHQQSVPENILEYHRAWFTDIDGDGRVELLYAYYPATAERDGDTLFCYSDRGREKWRFVPGRAVSTGATAFPQTYHLARLAPLAPERDRTRKIVVTSFHMPRYPAQVVVLSHRGAVLGEYWHSGHLGPMALADLHGDGDQEILLAGISNGYGAATLLVLDPSDLGGASLEGNQDYQLQGFGPGREKARILFPRTCINRKFYPYGVPGRVVVHGDSIEVQVAERPDATVDSSVLYFLNQKLELTQVVVSDSLKTLHRELEAAGQLDHPLTDKEISELRNLRYLKRFGP